MGFLNDDETPTNAGGMPAGVAVTAATIAAFKLLGLFEITAPVAGLAAAAVAVTNEFEAVVELAAAAIGFDDDHEIVFCFICLSNADST